MRRRSVARTGPLSGAAGHAVMVILSIFCLLPVYWMLITSLRPANKIFEAGI